MRIIAIDLELDPGNSYNILQLGAVAFDTDNHNDCHMYNQYLKHDKPPQWDFVLNTKQTLKEFLPDTFVNTWDNEAVYYQQALIDFWAWVKKINSGKKIVQWGSGDLKLLLEQSKGTGYPNNLRCLDLKSTYQFIYQPAARYPKEHSLSAACNHIGIPLSLPLHDALNDAYMTGRLFCKIFRNVSILEAIKAELQAT